VYKKKIKNTSHLESHEKRQSDKKAPKGCSLTNQKAIHLEKKTSDIYIIKSQLQSKSAAEGKGSFPSIITELNIIFQSLADCKWGLQLIQELVYHRSY
jgi:hypothetical protein